jgi:hypothetical protein
MRIGAGLLAASHSATAYTHAASQNTGYGVERGSLYALHCASNSNNSSNSSSSAAPQVQSAALEDAAWKLLTTPHSADGVYMQQVVTSRLWSSDCRKMSWGHALAISVHLARGRSSTYVLSGWPCRRGAAASSHLEVVASHDLTTSIIESTTQESTAAPSPRMCNSILRAQNRSIAAPGPVCKFLKFVPFKKTLCCVST